MDVSDIVIVHDDHLPRELWKLGRILDVMKGRDGQISGATIKMARKDGREGPTVIPVKGQEPIESPKIKYRLQKSQRTHEIVHKYSLLPMMNPMVNRRFLCVPGVPQPKRQTNAGEPACLISRS